MVAASEAFRRCAELIRDADGLLITAGAGLGVDSGLPDFRGNEGMWRAYPALGRARLQFEEIANPAAFVGQPRLAWGFYGHRLQLYRSTRPGPAFSLLRQISERLPAGSFVFTSNVDGQFQQAGFDPARIVECHGSIHQLQCSQPCSTRLWSADGVQPEIDPEACELLSPLPRCPQCDALARPNILMFGDWHWVEHHTEAQYQRLQHWREQIDKLVVIELGAGSAVATVRRFSEMQDAPLIRINPREPALGRASGVSIAAGASTAMAGIAAALSD